jgi:DNA polymerase-1
MYRAFYAIPGTMRTATGEQTNAVYGVVSMLISILKVEEPTHLLFCFDAGEETFRHQENETYKDGRAATPDEFFTQIPRIIQFIESIQIPHVSDVKYEADDFLGAYAVSAEKAGMKVTIVTGDRDAFQLATENVRIAIPHKAYQQPEYMGPEQILAKYGVRPDQIASYKGLVGDSSDNLPGVKGIGPKGAADLLQKYQTLENLYAHLDELKPVVKAKLEADKEKAFFCEHMAQLVCNIPLPIPLEEVAFQNVPVKPALDLFGELEFSSLSRRLLSLAKSEYGQKCFTDVPEDISAQKAKVEVKEEDQLSLF